MNNKGSKLKTMKKPKNKILTHVVALFDTPNNLSLLSR